MAVGVPGPGINDVPAGPFLLLVEDAPSPTAALEEAASAGFHGVQLAADFPGSSLISRSSEELEAIRRVREMLGLHISAAAPSGLSLRVWDRDRTQGLITYLGRLITAAEAVGAASLLFHAGSAPSAVTLLDLSNSSRQQMLQAFHANLMRVVGLGVGRLLLCMAADDLGPEELGLAEPLLEAGFLRLSLDLGTRHGQGTRADELLDRYGNCVGQVRLVGSEPPPDVEATLSLLLQLDVQEWCIVPWPGEPPSLCLASWKGALQRAWDRLVSGNPAD